MGQITLLFVRKVLARAEGDFDRDALLHSLEINPADLQDPANMIPDTTYYDFLEALSTVDRNPRTLPLRAGNSMRCEDYGCFGLAFKSAENLRASFARAERYARVLTSVSTYAVEATSDGALMHLHREGERRLGLRLSNEATIASIATISKEVSSAEVQAEAIYLKHPEPDSKAEHEAFFGCPVYFNADKDALLFSNTILETPNKVADAGIARYFDQRLESEVSRLEQEVDIEALVKTKISEALSDGVPSIAIVAGRLGMGARTLQRRLSDRGSSFQELVSESQCQLARNLLRQTRFSLVEIAFMTGFSEQSAFSRAFKRWVGSTPGSYRDPGKQASTA